MTRILVQRGSAGSSSSQSRSPLPGSSLASASASASAPATATASAPTTATASASPSSASQISSSSKDEEHDRESQDICPLDGLLDCCKIEDENTTRNDDSLSESSPSAKTEAFISDFPDKEKAGIGISDIENVNRNIDENKSSGVGCSEVNLGSLRPPPPPVPPPKPTMMSFNSRTMLGGSGAAPWVGSFRRGVIWPTVSARTSPSASRPSSPRSYGEGEGYNSADEQNSRFGSSYGDAEKDRQFELDIRRAKGWEVKRMLEDGNCLFRAIADQVYGDCEAYDLTRQMCIDYMERERDHFSQFITEGFTSYCKRKRRDKVYGNNVEIQALSEMYNRPIHIYSYSTEPINIFHGNYNTDSPPIRLSYHHGNHYNSLVDPRRLNIGAGLGFSSLRGARIDKDKVKAAIRDQQDQQIDNALLAEGRFYSDLELTEKEIERMVMEASRAEYLADNKCKLQMGFKEPSTSEAKPSSSGATTGTSQSSGGISMLEAVRRGESDQCEMVTGSSVQIVLSMGFSYLQVMEAYSIFGEDVDSMICYLVETGSSSIGPSGLNRLKGKAAE